MRRRRRLGPLAAQVRLGDYARCPRCAGRLSGSPGRSLVVTSRTIVVCGWCVVAERVDGDRTPVTAWPVPRRQWLRPHPPWVTAESPRNEPAASSAA